MKKNLPYLNQERLDVIFDHVYDIVSDNKSGRLFDDEKMNEFGIDGLYPPTMKYLEFVIVDNGN